MQKKERQQEGGRRIRRRAAKKLNPYSTKLSSSASILSLYPYHQVALIIEGINQNQTLVLSMLMMLLN
ncbi:MAG TPA: hypothetical protein VGE97_06810 [Nitrososphaera sp.]